MADAADQLLQRNKWTVRGVSGFVRWSSLPLILALTIASCTVAITTCRYLMIGKHYQFRGLIADATLMLLMITGFVAIAILLRWQACHGRPLFGHVVHLFSDPLRSRKNALEVSERVAASIFCVGAVVFNAFQVTPELACLPSWTACHDICSNDRYARIAYHFVLVAFIAAELAFCFLFDVPKAQQVVWMPLAFGAIQVANLAVWYDSLLDESDFSLPVPTELNGTHGEHDGEVGCACFFEAVASNVSFSWVDAMCYVDKTTRHTMKTDATPYLSPFNAEFLLLATKIVFDHAVVEKDSNRGVVNNEGGGENANRAPGDTTRAERERWRTHAASRGTDTENHLDSHTVGTALQEGTSTTNRGETGTSGEMVSTSGTSTVAGCIGANVNSSADDNKHAKETLSHTNNDEEPLLQRRGRNEESLQISEQVLRPHNPRSATEQMQHLDQVPAEQPSSHSRLCATRFGQLMTIVLLSAFLIHLANPIAAFVTYYNDNRNVTEWCYRNIYVRFRYSYWSFMLLTTILGYVAVCKTADLSGRCKPRRLERFEYFVLFSIVGPIIEITFSLIANVQTGDDISPTIRVLSDEVFNILQDVLQTAFYVFAARLTLLADGVRPDPWRLLYKAVLLNFALCNLSVWAEDSFVEMKSQDKFFQSKYFETWSIIYNVGIPIVLSYRLNSMFLFFSIALSMGREPTSTPLPPDDTDGGQINLRAGP